MRFSLISVLATALIFIGLCKADSYDQNLSKRAVYYSLATFCENNDLEDWKCGKSCAAVPGVTKLTRLSDKTAGVFGYVAYNHESDQIIVAFRGSDNIANWIANINFFQTPYKNVPGAQVHRGFYASYMDVET